MYGRLSGGAARSAFAFATPDELRHARLPRALLTIEHDLGRFGRDETHGWGYRVFRQVITTVAATPSGKLRPGFATWGLALAQSCGGLAPNIPPQGPMPFCLFRRAALEAPAVAHAALDISPIDPYYVDVNNSRSEPDFDIQHCGPQTPFLHALIRRTAASGFLEPTPDLPLFRRILARSSDRSLNATDVQHRSPFEETVICCCTRPAHTPGFAKAKAMSYALIDRAEADGGGVDLHRASSRVWFGLDPTLSAVDHPKLDQSDRAKRLDLLVDAVQQAVQRQLTFRATLLPSLAAVLVNPPVSFRLQGLPVRDILLLIVSFVLRPPSS
jgi:hypothetical protein